MEGQIKGELKLILSYLILYIFIAGGIPYDAPGAQITPPPSFIFDFCIVFMLISC